VYDKYETIEPGNIFSSSPLCFLPSRHGKFSLLNIMLVNVVGGMACDLQTARFSLN
jgi:hypothetical protein